MTPGSPSEARAGHEGLLVVAICFLTVIFDGYDLIVYGAVVPSLLDEPGWHLTPGRPARSAATPSSGC